MHPRDVFLDNWHFTQHRIEDIVGIAQVDADKICGETTCKVFLVGIM